MATNVEEPVTSMPSERLLDMVEKVSSTLESPSILTPSWPFPHTLSPASTGDALYILTPCLRQFVITLCSMEMSA